MNDTIFALSSGAPPAAIGVIRISGERAGSALAALCGGLPPARRPVVRRLSDGDGEPLDEALVLWFPGTRTATGEPLAELHCHGGRAVIAAVLKELETHEDLREAEPGEFTRRAFANGRIDLSQAEGLADLLSSETEWQRRQALVQAEGSLSRKVEDWRRRILQAGAQVEAILDFGDEDDVGDLPAQFSTDLALLCDEMISLAGQPTAERLRDGVRVVFAGPPNAGKSSLFNALIEENASIVSVREGTTRDFIERPIALRGIPFVLVDTAGLRSQGADEIEAIGVERTMIQMARADIVLWLGDPSDAPAGALRIHSKADLLPASSEVDAVVSAVTGCGIGDLVEVLVRRARLILPPPDTISANRRQSGLVREAAGHLSDARAIHDPLIVGEALRSARVALDRLTGRQSTEDMLDTLFGRFCIGK